MKSFFGITGTQAKASGLPVFRAGSGLKNGTLSLLANYTISPSWSIVTGVSYKRLMSGAADSPLVKLRGSANQLTGSSFVVYTF